MLYPAELRAPGRAIAAAMRLVQVTLPGRWLCSFLLVARCPARAPRAADQPAVVAVAGHDASVLRLGDGRRVRLAGIHVPPLADGGLDPAAVLALDGLIGTAGCRCRRPRGCSTATVGCACRCMPTAVPGCRASWCGAGWRWPHRRPTCRSRCSRPCWLWSGRRARPGKGSGAAAAADPGRRTGSLRCGWVRAGAWPSPAGRACAGFRLSQLRRRLAQRFHRSGRSSAGGPLRQGGPRAQGARRAERRGPRAAVPDQWPDDRPRRIPARSRPSNEAFPARHARRPDRGAGGLHARAQSRYRRIAVHLAVASRGATARRGRSIPRRWPSSVAPTTTQN